MKVAHAYFICSENNGIIRNLTMSDSLLKKKHLTIVFQKTRQSASSVVCRSIKIRSDHNFDSLLTKYVTGK